MQPLRPETFPLTPFHDATPLLADSMRLRNLADEQGYLFLPALLPPKLVVPVRAFVRAFCLEHGWVASVAGEPPELIGAPGARLDGRGWDDARFVELQRRLRVLPEFQALGQSAAIAQVLETIYGGPAWMATANYCWLKFPGSPAQTTRPHQDEFYLPDVPRLWTAWVPLVDTPLDVGPLGVVAGSHRTGLWPHVDAQTGIAVSPEVHWATQAVSAGDVVLFGTRTVHCAWSNVSQTLVRASLDIRYEPRPLRGGTPLRPQP